MTRSAVARHSLFVVVRRCSAYMYMACLASISLCVRLYGRVSAYRAIVHSFADWPASAFGVLGFDLTLFRLYGRVSAYRTIVTQSRIGQRQFFLCCGVFSACLASISLCFVCTVVFLLTVQSPLSRGLASASFSCVVCKARGSHLCGISSWQKGLPKKNNA